MDTTLSAASLRTYAVWTGVLLLVSFAAGGFGEFYAPSVILAPGAAATTQNIAAHEPLFRLGFAAYLLEALCDVALTFLFFVLLRVVDRDLALLAAFFRLIATATFATAETFYFAALPIMQAPGTAPALSHSQLGALGYLALTIYSYAGELFMVFYGAGAIVIGILIYRSGFLPRILGALFALGGIGFVANNFALVLAPAYAFAWLPLPMILAMLSLGLWLAIRGNRLQRSTIAI